VVLGEAGRVLPVGQGGGSRPGAGGAQQAVGAQRSFAARRVGVERDNHPAFRERPGGGLEGGDLAGAQRGT